MFENIVQRVLRVRFNLITAVWMMVVASALLFLNVRVRAGRKYITLDSEEATIEVGMLMRGEKPDQFDGRFLVRGWPVPYYEWDPSLESAEHFSVHGFQSSALVLDGVIALAILSAAAFGSERIIRNHAIQIQH